MADQQLRASQTSAAPLSYTVPGAAEIILKALRATFDGTAAASAFLPAIEIIAPGGASCGVFPTDTVVAAGGSADVSFAPFLRGEASGTGSGVGVEHNGALIAIEDNVDFVDGGVTWTVTDDAANSRVRVSGTGGGGGGTGLPNASWIAPESFPNQNIGPTSEAQITMHDGTFVTTDATIFDSTTNAIVILAPGLYLALGHVVNDPTGPTIDKTSLSIRWRTDAATNERVVPRDFARNDSGGTLSVPNGDGTTDWVECISWAYVAAAGTGTSVQLWYFNHDANPLGVNPGDRLLTVMQIQPILAATIGAYPAFPA